MDQQSMEVLERRAAVEAFTRSMCDPPPMARPRDTGCDLRLARRPRIRAQRCGVKLLESSTPPGYEETARQKLAEAVRSICVSELPQTGSREELYRLVEALCTSGRSQLVFTELSQQVVRQLEEQLSGCSAESAAERLEQLVAVWRKMCQAFRQISKIYNFLDAAFVRRLENDVLDDVFRRHFRRKLAALPQLCSTAVEGALQLVQEERDGKAIDQQLFKSLIEMLRSLSFYKDFESKFFERTTEFYRKESEAWLQTCSLADYLLLSEQHLSKEKRRCDHYVLDPATLQPLLEVLRQEILAQHAQRLLSMGFAELVQGVEVDHLARLYQQYKDIGALALVRKAFHDAFYKGGLQVLQGGDDAKVVVPELVRFLSSMQEVLHVAFLGDCNLAIALKEASEGFLNSAAPNQAAKLLARYMDILLRGDGTAPATQLTQPSQGDLQFSPPRVNEGNKEDTEVHIKQALQIFRYLAAKDAFEAFFKKDLARRLLLQRSACREMEHYASSLLREECGAAYTAGIEGMFQDMEISKVLAEVFDSSAEAKDILEDLGVDFRVSVLTTGRWPSPPPSCEIQLPLPLQRLATCFASFYVQQHRGRSLRWCPAWGQCLLRANANTSRKELVVSHFQALVLLCFNTADQLSYEEICKATQIPDTELQLTLQSLSLHKTVKLLLKGSKERQIRPGETFSYNSAFTHKLYRITVSQISPKEQLQEEDAVEQRLVGSRVHELDAVVIRIMKIKKKMIHQALISEVLMTLRFPAEAADIKRRIESLIERECLERHPPNEQGVTCYTYLA